LLAGDEVPAKPELSCPSRKWTKRRGGLWNTCTEDHAMSEKQRRSVDVHQRVAALKRHLLDHTPVSQICAELDVSVNSFYQWQKEFFENGHRAFEKNGRRDTRVEDTKQKKIDTLEARLQRRDGVIAELMEEHVALKKNLGDA
jgi:transposase-like protein